MSQSKRSSRVQSRRGSLAPSRCSTFAIHLLSSNFNVADNDDEHDEEEEIKMRFIFQHRLASVAASRVQSRVGSRMGSRLHIIIIRFRKHHMYVYVLHYVGIPS